MYIVHVGSDSGCTPDWVIPPFTATVMVVLRGSHYSVKGELILPARVFNAFVFDDILRFCQNLNQLPPDERRAALMLLTVAALENDADLFSRLYDTLESGRIPFEAFNVGIRRLSHAVIFPQAGLQYSASSSVYVQHGVNTQPLLKAVVSIWVRKEGD